MLCQVSPMLAFFVCMATKDNKIEVRSDLSSDSFLASSAHFSIRRGLPSDVISADNGQNFVGTWAKSRSAFNPMNYMIRQTSSLPPSISVMEELCQSMPVYVSQLILLAVKKLILFIYTSVYM